MENFYFWIFISFCISVLLLILYSKVISSKPRKRSQKQQYLDELFELSQSNGEKFSDVILRDRLIRLDTVLEKALAYHFRNSESLGSNLKKLNQKVDRSLLNKVWESHKLRNEVVHNSRSITEKQLKNAYMSYNQLVNKVL